MIRAKYTPLASFTNKMCEIRLRSMRNMFVISENRRMLTIIHHTLMDLEFAINRDFSTKEKNEYIAMFIELGKSMLEHDYASVENQLREIDFHIHLGETQTKKRLLDDYDGMDNFGLFSKLPMDLRRIIGCKLE